MLSAVISIYQDIHMKTSDSLFRTYTPWLLLNYTRWHVLLISEKSPWSWNYSSYVLNYWSYQRRGDNGKCREFMAVLPIRSPFWRSARANLFLCCKFITTCISFPLKLDQYVYFLTMKDNANTTVVMKNRKESCIQHLDWPQGRSIDFRGPRAKRHQGPLVYGSEVFLGQGAMAPYSRIF
jgi:hypothetical protein